jgi:hypothetical protein
MESATNKYFMIAPNLVPDAVLGINFLHKNNVEMNFAEERFGTRGNGSNYQRKFFYDSLPKGKVGVGLVARLEVESNLIGSLTTRRKDGKNNTVGAETTETLISMRKESQRALLKYCDKIKLNGLGADVRDGDTFISDDVRRSDEAVLHKSDGNADVRDGDTFI